MARAKSQIAGQTQHLLLSLRGKRWKEVNLALFAIYIDDSGTDPTQHVAIATALVIPAAQIAPLESEWGGFKEKENFKRFHTSECLFSRDAKKSEFGNWDDAKRIRVFRRVCQIAKKYGSRAFSIAVNKADYDEVVPTEIRDYLGKSHYSWAVRQLLVNVDQLFPMRDAPREFIFDWMERHVLARSEIENIMDEMQFVSDRLGIPADYSDPHFRKSEGIPALQCVDAVGWVSYQYALRIFRNTPLRPFVPEAWRNFEGNLHFDGWLRAGTLTRQSLAMSINEARQSEQFSRHRKAWQEYRALSQQKRA